MTTTRSSAISPAPIPSLQSIDGQGRVIYMGTFSRSVAPALRISYMVLPETLLRRYHENYRGFSSTVSGFEQAVLRQFMLEGHFETHVNRMRIYYRSRRQCLVDALEPLSPWMEILGQPAGHHLTLRLSNGMNEEALVSSAKALGVRVYPISPDFLDGVARSPINPRYCWALAVSPTRKSAWAPDC